MSHATHQIRLRPMTRDDLPMLREWFLDETLMNELGGMADLETTFAYAESQPRYWEWIALDGETSVGFVGLEIQEDGIGYIAPATRPDRRRQGYGVAILRALVATPEARQASCVAADICPDNAASIRCHEKAGFVRESEEPDEEGFLRFAYRFDR